MTTPPGPEDAQPWQGSTPSPEFLAAYQAEMARQAAETASEPLTPMDVACITAHTIFQSATRPGLFSDRQAIILAVELLTRNP